MSHEDNDGSPGSDNDDRSMFIPDPDSDESDHDTATGHSGSYEDDVDSDESDTDIASETTWQPTQPLSSTLKPSVNTKDSQKPATHWTCHYCHRKNTIGLQPVCTWGCEHRRCSLCTTAYAHAELNDAIVPVGGRKFEVLGDEGERR